MTKLITIGLDTKNLEKELSVLELKNIPRALANVSNRLASGSVLKLQDEMKARFKNPTPWTLGMFKSLRAKKGHPLAAVVTKDLSPGYRGGTAAARYISPDVFGEERELKKSERNLSRLSGGQEWVPGKDTPLDQYGNIKKSEVVKLLSRLQVASKQSLNMTEKKSAQLQRQKKTARGQKSEYFIAHDKENGRATGVYKYSGTPGKVLQILRFIPTNAHYRKILPASEIVEALVKRRGPRYVMEEIAKATAKSRI